MPFHQYHTRRTDRNFDTSKGTTITQGLKNLAVKYNIAYQYGTAPHDFTLTQSVSF